MRRTLPSTRPEEPGWPVMTPSASGLRDTGAEASNTSVRRSGSAAHWNGSNRPRIQMGRGGSARYFSWVSRRAAIKAVGDLSPASTSPTSSIPRKKMSSPSPVNSPARRNRARMTPIVRVSSERVASRIAFVWTTWSILSFIAWAFVGGISRSIFSQMLSNLARRCSCRFAIDDADWASVSSCRSSQLGSS